jgi:hypothetical protein
MKKTKAGQIWWKLHNILFQKGIIKIKTLLVFVMFESIYKLVSHIKAGVSKVHEMAPTKLREDFMMNERMNFSKDDAIFCVINWSWHILVHAILGSFNFIFVLRNTWFEIYWPACFKYLRIGHVVDNIYIFSYIVV